MTEKDKECNCRNSSSELRKFVALVKVDGIEEPIRFEKVASNLEEFKAIISKEHKTFTFLTFQEDI